MATLIYRILDLKTKTPDPETYRTALKKFNHYLNELLPIVDDPDKHLMTKRSEVIFQCRQQNKFKLVNLMSYKTSNDVI